MPSLIALAVWFPTTVLTSSGIASIPNSYFEVSSTLGAGSLYRIVKVGIPAAMPHMFLGLFNGTCSSFITLVTAEMLGAKYGIGWYINWQKEMMAYANVYAGLIIIAVTFFILITLLFKVPRSRAAWQKGSYQMVGKYFDFGCIQAFCQSHRRTHYRARQCVAFDIPAGSFVSLIGPSGCGKSTLLRLISGLIPMDDGSLTLDGTPIKAPGADRGFMFQEHTLFPWLSIYDNIAFGLRARGIYKQEKDRVDEFIEMVGLKGFEHSYPHQLSGGMCQRASRTRPCRQAQGAAAR